MNFIKKYSISVFFMTTICISWILWIPLLIYGNNQIKILGTFSPLVMAIILTYLLEGSSGIKNLFRKFTIWKVQYFWYLFSFLSTAVVVMISISIYRLMGGQELHFNDISQWYLIIIAFLYVLFLSVLGEEAGWRGFALPRLQKKYNALISSLIIGSLWGIWHLPLFFMEGNFHGSIPFVLFFIQDIAFSIIYTWIYNNTKGSLLIAHLFHTASNVTLGVLPILPTSTGGDTRPLWIAVIILVMLAIFIVIKYSPENLSNTKRIVE